jgi:hypothetical protein
MLGEGIGREIVKLDLCECGREPEGLGGTGVWGHLVSAMIQTTFCGNWASAVMERKAKKRGRSERVCMGQVE